MIERISYVEIDLNRCSEVYGVGACTASIPATGTDKCFNCFATCQDKTNYNKETVTSRHSTASGTLPIDIDAIPDLAAVSIRPAQLDLGESIGVRASVTLTFKDARYPDTGPEGDRYLSDRNYDPYTQGSYWGKFRARYPFTQGADIRLIRGDSSQSLAQMETRHFIVDNVSGPDSKGTFTIVCKDALKLADGKKAQAPVVSVGVTEFPISPTSTSFLLSPGGIGNLEYPTSGVINLGGKELCRFSRSGDTMDIGTLGERGAFGTTAVAHGAGDRAQIAVEYVPQQVSYILEDLLVTYANVPSDYIDFPNWLAEDTAYVDRNYSAVLAEPESVTDLVNELLQQTASTIWWDDVNKKIQFKVLNSVSPDAPRYDDNLILADSFSAIDQNAKRVSQVWTFYGQINPLEKLDDKSNYSQGRVIYSAESESNFEGVPSIKSIFSRWIPVNGENAATRLNQLILSRYTTPPRLLKFSLQKDQNLNIPLLANDYNISNFTLQTATGALATVPVQLTQVKDTDTGYSVIGEEVLYTDTVSTDDSSVKPLPLYTGLNQNIREVFDSVYPTVSEFDVINITIDSAQTLGSSSTDLPALITGDWPANVTLNLLNSGLIIGKGGAGGQGGTSLELQGAGFGASGEDGGVAFEASYDIEITNGGIIGGGGGGGSGGGAVYSNGALYVGGGGGGAGAGSTSSLGGVGGVASQTDFPGVGKSGLSGVVSSSQVPGDGGIPVVVDSVFFTTVPPFPGGAGGKGGLLGEDGERGTRGSNNGITSIEVGNRFSGGTAGAAINKNGYTVAVTGNIPLGDVNP